MKAQKLKKLHLNYLSIASLLIISMSFIFAVFASSLSSSQQLELCNSTSSSCGVSQVKLASGCGAGSGFVDTSIDFGCQGNSCGSGTSASGYCSANHSGIIDLLFAIIRFLSAGVGLIIVLSVIIGGIQYILSRGDPNATGAAIKRLTSAVVALLVFIFAYAILNFVIPGGFFTGQ